MKDKQYESKHPLKHIFTIKKEVSAVLNKVLRKLFIISRDYTILISHQLPCNEKYSLKPISHELIDMMQSIYPSELSTTKAEVLHSRVDSIVKGFIILNEENISIGYCHFTGESQFCPVIEHNHYASADEYFFLDDYVFKKYRNKGVHSFSIKARLNILVTLGIKVVRVNILQGSPSVFSYLRVGFIRSSIRLTIKLFTNINAIRIDNLFWLKLKLYRTIINEIRAIFLFLNGSVKRRLERIDTDKLIISFYWHKPTIHQFRNNCEWLLKEDFKFISTKDLKNILLSGIHPGGRLVHLSFDDGWCSNSEIIDYCEKRGIPLTIFISTSAVDTGYFWWSLTPSLTKKVSEIKSVPEKMRKTLCNSATSTFIPSREAFSHFDISQIIKSPILTIGSHTHNHVVMPNCTNDELEYELSFSTQLIETWTKYTPYCFAYPNGDFDRRVIEKMEASTYTICFTTGSEYIQVDIVNIMSLPRFCGVEFAGKYENRCRSIGLWQHRKD